MEISISFKKKSLLCAFILLMHNASYSFTLSFHKINTKTAVMSIGIVVLVIFFPTLRHYYNSYCLQHKLRRCFGDRESIAACVNFYKQWRNGNENLPILFFVGNQANYALDLFSQYVTNYEKKECRSFHLNELSKISWDREKILFLIDNRENNFGHVSLEANIVDNSASDIGHVSLKEAIFDESRLLNVQIEICTFNNSSLSA